MSDVDYLASILKGIVAFPESIQIDRVVDEKGVLLNVTLDRSDMGKVIGRSGNTAKAIRILMHAFGYAVRATISVKILEPNN